MTLLRSLLYAALFYPGTLMWVLSGFAVSPFSRKLTLGVVFGWVRMNHWLARHVLGIETRLEGAFPDGPHLIAVKHQSMFETMEMLRVSNLPVIVVKRELADMPLFGFMTRQYGIVAVDRTGGSKALRALVEGGKAAVASGRGVLIYPEGTRVRVGETPELKSGFAALYRSLGLPVVPVALDSGRLWGEGLIHRSGMVTFKIGETIAPGLKRDEVERRVHAAINAFELGPEARA